MTRLGDYTVNHVRFSANFRCFRQQQHTEGQWKCRDVGSKLNSGNISIIIPHKLNASWVMEYKSNRSAFKICFSPSSSAARIQ